MVSRPSRSSALKVGSYKEPSMNDIPMAEEDDADQDSDPDQSSASYDDDGNDSSDAIQLPSTGKRKRDETSQNSDEDDDNNGDDGRGNNDAKHDDSDNSDGDDSLTLIIPKRNKRGRPKGSIGKRPGEPKERKHGSLAERTCPHCGKVFSIILGLAYHLKHKVCMKVNSNAAVGTAPMPLVHEGDCFVTDFGVVKVLKDERAGDDFGKTLVSSNIKKDMIYFTRQKERFRNRRDKLFLYQAKLNRKRRQKFHDLYLQKNEKQISEKEFANGLFDNYISGISANHVLAGLFRAEVKSAPSPIHIEDPMQPKDCYPERIVECVLIKDERKRIKDLEEEEDKKVNHIDVATVIVAKAHKVKRRKNGSATTGTDKVHESGMKVYMRRNLLTLPYDKHVPVYTCSDCGKSFTTRAGCKLHRDEKTCTEQKENIKEMREKRIKEVEESLELQAIQLSGPRHAKNSVKKIDTRKRGRKPGRVYPSWLVFYADKSPLYPEVFDILKCKRGSNNSNFMKKILEAKGPGRKKIRKSRAKGARNLSLKSEDDDDDDDDDDDENSTSFHDSVGGSSVSPPPRKSRGAAQKAKAKMAQYHDKDSDGEEKSDDEYHIAADDDDDYHDNGGIAFESVEMPPLPPLPPLPAPQDTNQMPPLPIVDDSSTFSPQGQAKQSNRRKADSSIASSSADESSTKKSWIEPLKKKNKIRPASAPINLVSESSNSLVIDIRPLVEEVRAGRYPSMKSYTGEHLDICFICKTEDKDVYHCEFCCNSEHLVCLQSKLTIRNLEPDDEFMCHRCIQTCMSRRNRAERRRQEKLTKVSSSTAAANSEPKPQIVWNKTNEEIDAFISTYNKCPNGGSGGLVCCQHCSNAYSKLLTDTSKEMEVQTVSSLGREVSELIELLNDAQARLKQAVDVTNLNDVRRSLLSKSEREGHSSSNRSQGI